MATLTQTKTPPGPSLIQVLGDMKLVLGDRLRWMEKLHREYGDIIRIPLGPRVSYAVFHPEYAKQILVTNAKKYCKGRTFEKTAAYLGNGLATSEGEEWLVQRRRVNPKFSRESLADLTPLMTDSIGRMLKRWEGREASIDLSAEFQRLAMEVVARTLFGASIDENQVETIIEAFKIALKFTTSRTLNPINIPESLPLPSNIRFRRAIEQLDRIVYQMIEDEKSKSEPSNTLLSLLLHAEDPETGERMGDRQLRDEVMTAFIGGTDTTGNSLSWVFYNLHQHQEVQKRMRAEIEAVVGGGVPKSEHFKQLDYTTRTIRESLRLFPQNWTMSRDTKEEDTIGGYTIPADSTVFIGAYIIHRRPDFWSHPLTFDPDRFLPENTKGADRFRYIPFGGGARMCLGFQLSMMEMTYALAMILQKYSFTLPHFDQIERNPIWSLWPEPAVLAQLARS